MPERILVSNLSKAFGTVRAVDNVSFSVGEREFFSLLGPSGCGKTTTLRCVAGLEQPTAGKIVVGGRTVTSPEEGIFVLPEHRKMGMVFQNYAVWPHMTVIQNVAYPLKLARIPRDVAMRRAADVLDMLKLSGLEGRYPSELSGGQQQRVALGRALVMDPEVMLLDEPLSNLDAKLREQMRFELKDLQRKTGIAILYVTHDQVEAMAMSDRVAVMNNGVIVQEGKPSEIYTNPKEKFVADFIGTMNFLPCEVLESGSGNTVIRLKDGTIIDLPQATDIRGECTVAIRPEDVEIVREPGGGVQCEVEVGIFLGNLIDYRIRLGEERLRVQSIVAGVFEPGEKAYVRVTRSLLFK
jgi:iron(III) transport system ATP-binding protein